MRRFTFVAFFSNHFGQNILLKDADFFFPQSGSYVNARGI